MCVAARLMSKNDSILAMIRTIQARGFLVVYTYDPKCLGIGIYSIAHVQVGYERQITYSEKNIYFEQPRSFEQIIPYLQFVLNHYKLANFR